MNIWTITDDKAGNQTQAIALANSIANLIIKRSRAKTPPTVTITEKRVSLSLPWRWLPPSLWYRNTTTINQDITPKHDDDCPHIIISCGRQSIGISRYLRDTHNAFTVHIQNPRINFHDFDVVIAPMHDAITGDNVIVSNGAISRFNRRDLDVVKNNTLEKYNHLPRPIIAVTIGGENKAYTITESFAEKMCIKLKTIARETGGSLLITPSRRTGIQNTHKLKRSLSYVSGLFWDGKGDNPYEEFLAHADMCIVTNDSVNMITDCIATQTPVYLMHLPSKPNPLQRGKKFKSFIQSIQQQGLAYPLDKLMVNLHSKKKLKISTKNQTETIAQDILKRYKTHTTK